MTTGDGQVTSEEGSLPAAADAEASADGPIDVDWSSGGRAIVSLRTVLATGGFLAVGGLYAYDLLVLGDEPVAFGYDLGRLEWLWIACLWIDLVYVGMPAVRNRERTVAFLGRLRERPATLAATLFLSVVVLAGTLGPAVFTQPSPDFAYSNQPPLFASVDVANLANCHNPVGDRCHGSWHYPLGTNGAGKGLLELTAFGARVVVQLAVVAVTMIVPLATVVGTAGAYAGGLADRIVTTLAKTLQSVPALLVFLVWRWIGDDGSLFSLVVAFGLVNWANVAIVVRSRALEEVSKDYVLAAEAGGAGSLAIVRDHLIPNVSRTAISAAVYQVPLFVTIEATLSFLEWGVPPSPLLLTPPTLESWGRMIGRNVGSVDPYWWTVGVPVATLLLTILSLNVVAHGLEGLLDPYSER